MIKLDPLDKAEAARYMGVRGKADAQTSALLEKYEPIVRAKLRPAYVYREAEVRFTDKEIYLTGLEIPLTGNSVRRHLKGCKKAVMLAATVSAEADKLIRQTAVTDMAGSLAVDCLCSAAIEQVCEKAEIEIFKVIEAPFRTWRFSPGYGDLPISIQKELLLTLNAQRRIGLTVTDSCLMVPTKSVTAIIGISDSPPENRKKGCSVCSMRESCAFKHNGGCGKDYKL